MHPMQSVYNNMQLQQSLQPQQVQLAQQQMPMDTMGYGGFYTNNNMMQPPGSTMQNVNVVDFKPDVMAQHQINQLQQQYQTQMGVPSVPTMGLIGPDGRFQPVTAASSSYGRQEDYNNRSFDDQNDPDTSRSIRKYDRSSQNGGGAVDSDYARSDPYPALESMINRSVDKCMKASQSAEADVQTTTNNFQKKTPDEQRKIIEAAVKEVTKRFEVDREISNVSSEKKSGNASRYKHSYDDY